MAIMDCPECGETMPAFGVCEECGYEADFDMDEYVGSWDLNIDTKSYYVNKD